MGLDQHAVARKGEPVKREERYTLTDSDGNTTEEVEYYNEWEDSYELAEWRKHPNLQGFMQDRWCGDGDFKCAYLE